MAFYLTRGKIHMAVITFLAQIMILYFLYILYEGVVVKEVHHSYNLGCRKEIMSLKVKSIGCMRNGC